MKVNGETVSIPVTLGDITVGARRYGAVVQGHTAAQVDIEFPDLHSAASFADNYGQDWVMDLRDPVTSLWSPVVLIVGRDTPAT